MIDFANIKTTPCGRRCEYGGPIVSLKGVTTYRYAVWIPGTGWGQWVFDIQGRRLIELNGDWFLHLNAEPIAHPPKRKLWAYYAKNGHSRCIWLSGQGPEYHVGFNHCQEVEVP